MQCIKFVRLVQHQASCRLRVTPLISVARTVQSRQYHILQSGSLPTLQSCHESTLRRFKVLCSHNNSVRRITSTAEQAAATLTSSLPAGYIPEPPIAPVLPEGLGTQDVIQQLTALGEPTLHSLGLGSWWPSGWVQTALEYLHVTFDIPWWSAIVIGTVILRTCVFPLVVIAQRNAATMHNHGPIVQKLQEKFTKSRMSGNPMEAARAGTELMEYMKINKFNPMKNMVVPFVQLPIFLSVFVGIRQMANLPVESMTTGGMAWFLDLTVPDPFYALPVLTMATFFITLELGVDGVRATSMTSTMRFVMRAMPFFIFPFIINFPTGMLCYWFTSNLFSLVQVLFLKIESVRTFFKIPQLVVHDESIVSQQKKGFIKTFKENWKNQNVQISMEERQRQEAVRFKEAGVGAIPKTYAYDPTKVKTKKLN